MGKLKITGPARVCCSIAALFLILFETACGGGESTSTIPPPLLAIATASSPDGTFGSAYEGTIQASGGVAPFTWSVSSGALPHSLSLTSSTTSSVMITGTPDQVQSGVALTIRVTDAQNATATQSYSVTIRPASPTLVSGPSPFPPGCDLSGSTAVNYENAEVEAQLAVDPTNSAHLVGIWQQDRWHGPGSHGLMTGVSRDGGKTWTRNFAIFSNCSGGTAANGADGERTGDPWITISPDGTVYESGGPFNTTDASEKVEVVRSTDGGDTWSMPTFLQFDTDPTIVQDKDSITADPLDSRFVYATWTRDIYTDSTQNVLVVGPIWLSRTIDGGASWEPASNIYTPPAGFEATGSLIVVQPNGTLVDMFLQHDNTTASYFTIRSTDKGVTWSQPSLIDASHDIGITDVKTGELVRGGVATIAVDPVNGTLYMVWQDARFSGGLRDGIAFSKSTDGGLTWSPPVQVNQAPNVQAFAPQIAVTSTGKIGITYYDFRKDTSDPATLLTNFWQITSQDGGKTWQEFPLSPSFDMRTAPVTGLGFMISDYEGLVPVGNSFFSLFVATNSGNTSNRTDVFAISSEAAGGGTENDGHVEVNSRPLPLAEQIRLPRAGRHPSLRR